MLSALARCPRAPEDREKLRRGLEQAARIVRPTHQRPRRTSFTLWSRGRARRTKVSGENGADERT